MIFAILTSFYCKGIKNENQKKMFSITTGFMVHLYVFGITALASITQNLLCYLLMVYLPASIQHKAVFVTSAVMLGAGQLHKQFSTPGVNGLDVPMNLMFNFCKVTSLVCSVRDGNTLRQKGPDSLKRREREFAIDQIPSFFDYWAYMYFMGASISGPFYEFKDFQDYMKG